MKELIMFLNCPMIECYVHYISFDVHVAKLKEVWSMKVAKMRIQVGGVGDRCVGGGSEVGWINGEVGC